jgi:hypothetical protein
MRTGLSTEARALPRSDDGMSGSNPAYPVAGPCVAWTDAEAVAACAGIDLSTDNAAGLEEQALSASMLLFEMSGRKFNGGCSQIVRPCRPTCSCWNTIGPASVAGTASWYWAPWQNVWNWQDGCGGICGCGFESAVKLSGYPVTEINAVTIDGVDLPEIDPDTGQPNWRLDRYTLLTRLDYRDDQGVVQPRRWPACQNLSLPDDQGGTWSVDYNYGDPPPLPGQIAAAQLAGELYKACNGGECALPQGVTRLQRQGVTIERGVLLTWGQSVTSRGIRTGSWTTGLELVDAFLSAYNPWGARRRPGFWSPDLTQYAQKLGA